MFEHHTQPLLSRAAFLRRIGRHTVMAVAIVVGSLLIGIIGYHVTEGLDWTDSLVNSAMLLGGMGPVNPLTTTMGKLFASFYALYSGLIFLLVAGVQFSPIVHRFLHRFHLEQSEQFNEESDSSE